MVARKKKTDGMKSSSTSVVVSNPQPAIKPKRIIPEVANTVHFYVHNQNLIRMESLDKNIRIDAELIKSILTEIKDRDLLGTNLFVVIFNDQTGEVTLDEIIDLQEEDLDEDLKKIINKIYTPSTEKTDGVE